MPVSLFGIGRAYLSTVALTLFAPFVTADNATPEPLVAVTDYPKNGVLPAFSVRLVNQTADICNSSTPGTSGFIDSVDGQDESHLFFWLFESKSLAPTDPVILWMTGGPGASSTGYGNLMELGPCRIAPEGGYTIENEFGWNKNATLLFVDQPLSVGFSTGSKIPNGLVEASEAMDIFLRQFFTAFPQLAARGFYIAGESYGGSWVPSLASTIHRKQHQVKNEGQINADWIQSQQFEEQQHLSAADEPSTLLPHINIKGVMIGNGLVRQPVQNAGAFEALCSGPQGIFNMSQCLQWAPRALWCENNLHICETGGWTTKECREAQALCSEMGEVVTGEMHRNPYDWRRACGDDPLGCYPEMPNIDSYLNSSHVKKALGVASSIHFKGVSFDVFNRWEEIGDLWKSSAEYVNYLLDEGIRILIYVGDKDFYCNAPGMRRLVNEGLNWHGHPFFRFRELVPWYHEARRVGRWKAYDQLTYAEIFDSGHLAPFDLPAEVLSLINGWLLNGQPPAQ